MAVAAATDSAGPSMFDLTFLGTSASVPSADRNHPSLLLEAGGHRIMVDCGEGTQRQLLRGGARFRRLDRLLLKHAHFDHVLGVPGLFLTLRLRQSTDVVTITAVVRGRLTIVVRMLAGLWGEGRAPSRCNSFRWWRGRVLDAGEFTVDCFRVRHRDTESFAYSFESQMRRHLLPGRLSALGVPDGPVRKELAEGKPIVLAERQEDRFRGRTGTAPRTQETCRRGRHGNDRRPERARSGRRPHGDRSDLSRTRCRYGP